MIALKKRKKQRKMLNKLEKRSRNKLSLAVVIQRRKEKWK